VVDVEELVEDLAVVTVEVEAVAVVDLVETVVAVEAAVEDLEPRHVEEAVEVSVVEEEEIVVVEEAAGVEHVQD
jgi:hypothetical protein